MSAASCGCPAASGPQCPPWCTSHSDAHGVHASATRYLADLIGVTIRQAGADPFLYFGGVRIELHDAGLLASAMAALGHPDFAAAITEVAAWADNGG
jgi:hypothetical protein